MRLALAWTAACWLATPASADAPELKTCRAIVADVERLACYDAIADRVPAESFGKTTAELETDGLTDIQSRVTSVRTDSLGKLVVGLENGQTWAQIDSTTLKLKAGDQVDIRRGSLGSYLLTRVDGGAEIRVRRK